MTASRATSVLEAVTRAEIGRTPGTVDVSKVTVARMAVLDEAQLTQLRSLVALAFAPDPNASYMGDNMPTDIGGVSTTAMVGGGYRSVYAYGGSSGPDGLDALHACFSETRSAEFG